jgi:hypothetical protein
LKNEDEFNRIWNETMNVVNIEEKKIPAHLGGIDVVSSI